MFRVGTALMVALVCGCSFDSFTGGRNEGLGDSQATSDGGNKPNVSGTRGVADGGEGDEEEGDDTGPPPGTSGPQLPPGDDGDGPRIDLGAPETTGDDEGMPVDCSMPSTFDLSIEDAVVIAPMTTEHVTGIGLAAYSTERNAGDLQFTIDVACPGTYFLHGFVLDLRPGVHSDDDPDSYVLQWPGGEGTWFYGCQTDDEDYDGWYWLPVRTGIQGEPCDSATTPAIELGEGQHQITVRNRERGEWYWGDYLVAAIARLVVTNDPSYVGM